jgi:hypothetical protein
MSRYREKHNKTQKQQTRKIKKDERQKALVFFIGQI